MENFINWLTNEKGLKENSAKSTMSRIGRIQKGYDMDKEYEIDGLEGMMAIFEKAITDAKEGLVPTINITIDGDYITGLGSLKRALSLYKEYKTSGAVCKNKTGCKAAGIEEEKIFASTRINANSVVSNAYEMYCDYYGKHDLIYKICDYLNPNDIVTVNNKSYCLARKYDKTDEINLITIDTEGKIETFNCCHNFKSNDDEVLYNMMGPSSQKRFLTICKDKIYQVRNIYKRNKSKYYLVAIDLEKKTYTVEEEFKTPAMHYFENKYGDKLLWTIKFIPDDEEYHLLNLKTGIKKIFDEILAYNDKYIYFRRKDKYYYTDYSLEHVVNFTNVFKGCDNSKIYYIDAKRDIIYFYEDDYPYNQIKLYGYHISGNKECVVKLPKFDGNIPSDYSTYFDGEALYIVVGCTGRNKMRPGIYKYDFDGNCINEHLFPPNLCGKVGCNCMVIMAGNIYGFVKYTQNDQVWFVSTKGENLIRYW